MPHRFPTTTTRLGARLACLALAAVATQAATPQTHVGSTGIYGLLPTNVAVSDRRVREFLLHPDLAGLSVRTYWRDLEPTRDGYDWDYLDGMIAAAEAAGKHVILRLEAAWASPSWVLTGVAYAGGPLYPYYERHAVTAPDEREAMPLPWDATYLAHWSDFVRALGARYDGNPVVAAVLVSGGSRSTEMYLPSARDGGPDWHAPPYDYTPAKLIEAWKAYIDLFAAAFPGKPFYLSLSSPLANDGVVEAVAAYGVARHPWHFCVKTSYWSDGMSGAYFPTAALLAVADECTHGGFEPAKAAADDISSAAIQNAIDWHVLGHFEVYFAQRDRFAVLRAAIEDRRRKIGGMTFSVAADGHGGLSLGCAIASPDLYPAGYAIRRRDAGYPRGVADGTGVGGILTTSAVAADPAPATEASAWYSVHDVDAGYVLAQGGARREPAMADAVVSSASPGASAGDASDMRLDADGDVRRAYLRFEVDGVPAANPIMAILRLHCTRGGADVFAHAVDDTTWTEDGLTWSTRPSYGETLAAARSPAAGAWIELDVSRHVTGDGTHTILLRTADGTGRLAIASRDGAAAAAPHLVITW